MGRVACGSAREDGALGFLGRAFRSTFDSWLLVGILKGRVGLGWGELFHKLGWWGVPKRTSDWENRQLTTEEDTDS